jgi:acyl-coenzyme A thioesterase PaaI-like protein
LTQPRRGAVLGLEARNQHEVFRFAGFRATVMEAGRGVVVIDPILPHHRGGGGSDAVNGAILAYLFDCGMGVALDSLYLGAPMDRHRATTMDLAVSYVRPCYGDVCVCESFVVGGGRRVIYTRGEVRDAEGTVCAQALGSYRVWPGGPQVHPLPGPPPPDFRPQRG